MAYGNGSAALKGKRARKKIKIKGVWPLELAKLAMGWLLDFLFFFFFLIFFNKFLMLFFFLKSYYL
jgi:hypothetical protein